MCGRAGEWAPASGVPPGCTAGARAAGVVLPVSELLAQPPLALPACPPPDRRGLARSPTRPSRPRHAALTRAASLALAPHPTPPSLRSMASIVEQYGLGDGQAWMANWEAAWAANLEACAPGRDGECSVR